MSQLSQTSTFNGTSAISAYPSPSTTSVYPAPSTPIDTNYIYKGVNFDDLIDQMKQQVKNKLLKELNSVKWFQLEKDTILMVGIQKENGGYETCQTSLNDLRRHLFNELLEELEKRGAQKDPSQD